MFVLLNLVIFVRVHPKKTELTEEEEKNQIHVDKHSGSLLVIPDDATGAIAYNVT